MLADLVVLLLRDLQGQLGTAASLLLLRDAHLADNRVLKDGHLRCCLDIAQRLVTLGEHISHHLVVDFAQVLQELY